MTIAYYNLKSADDGFRITKFDADMNVESSYLMGHANAGGLPECTCPAGTRPTCRHRQMWTSILPLVDTAFFWDFDHSMIVDGDGDQVTYLELEEAIATMPDGVERDNAIETAMPPLPEGVTAIGLDDPIALHNTIAEAVGEPEAIIQPATSWRRI